jgi:hypothetical protein
VIPFTTSSSFDVLDSPSGGAFTGAISAVVTTQEVAGDDQFLERYRITADLQRTEGRRSTAVQPEISDYSVSGSFDLRFNYSEATPRAVVVFGRSGDSVALDFGSSRYTVAFIGSPTESEPVGCSRTAIGVSGGYMGACRIAITDGATSLDVIGGFQADGGAPSSGSMTITIPATGLSVNYALSASGDLTITEGLKRSTVAFNSPLVQGAINNAMD